MQWSNEAPTEPGWYWCKLRSEEEAAVAQVKIYGGKLRALVPHDGWDVDLDGVLWAGPLEPPKHEEEQGPPPTPEEMSAICDEIFREEYGDLSVTPMLKPLCSVCKRPGDHVPGGIHCRGEP